jgi:hypothetical protein
MPVPVAVTHPKGAGLTAARPAELPTEGPFARLAKQRAEAEAQAKQQQQEAGQEKDQQQQNGHAAEAAAAAGGGAAAGPGPCSEAANGGAANGAAAAPSVAVRHLDFSYPGLGERARGRGGRRGAGLQVAAPPGAPSEAALCRGAR